MRKRSAGELSPLSHQHAVLGHQGASCSVVARSTGGFQVAIVDAYQIAVDFQCAPSFGRVGAPRPARPCPHLWASLVSSFASASSRQAMISRMQVGAQRARSGTW